MGEFRLKHWNEDIGEWVKITKKKVNVIFIYDDI